MLIIRLGTCDCIEGWSGPDCSAECTRETCNNHGECIDGVCLCDKNYDGDYCENHGSTLTGIIVLLILLNILTSYFWYKQAVSLFLFLLIHSIRQYLKERCT